MPQLTTIQELAHPLVARTSLEEIRLFESHGHQAELQSGGSRVQWSDLGVSITPIGDVEVGSAVFLMRADISLQELVEGGHDGKGGLDTAAQPTDLVTVSVTYGALYSIAGEPESVSLEMLGAFGTCVASLAMWPYIRAEMARLSEAMHTTPITLPMLTQHDLVGLAE